MVQFTSLPYEILNRIYSYSDEDTQNNLRISYNVFLKNPSNKLINLKQK